MGEINEIDFKLSGKEAEKDEKVGLWGGFDINYILEKHKISIFLGLVGLILVGAGLLFILKVSEPEDKIEIISSEETSAGEIFVDIGGAVQKPGVYKLSSGSRIQDLLVVAGGLSGEADREWVEKNLNRAERLSDGLKKYIPKKGETPLRPAQRDFAGQGGQVAGTTEKVNINTASKSELEALWGIGPVTAQKIIDNRPYQAVEDLLTKKILKSNVYQRIAEQLAVY